MQLKLLTHFINIRGIILMIKYNISAFKYKDISGIVRVVPWGDDKEMLLTDRVAIVVRDDSDYILYKPKGMPEAIAYIDQQLILSLEANQNIIYAIDQNDITEVWRSSHEIKRTKNIAHDILVLANTKWIVNRDKSFQMLTLTSDQTIEQSLIIPHKKQFVTQIRLSPNKKSMASSHLQRKCFLWDLQRQAEMCSMICKDDPTTIKFVNNNLLLVGGYDFGQTLLFDVRTSKQILAIPNMSVKRLVTNIELVGNRVFKGENDILVAHDLRRLTQGEILMYTANEAVITHICGNGTRVLVADRKGGLHVLAE